MYQQTAQIIAASLAFPIVAQEITDLDLKSSFTEGAKARAADAERRALLVDRRAELLRVITENYL